MTAIFLALAVVALVVYGLERNHSRNTRPGTRLAGSCDVEDRDLPRVRAELHPVAERPGARRDGRPRLSVRSA
ncbi:hypothetical protein [Saccharothrix coeruleofusca]|uniref:Uncharacterized protein n=1 Tax=Saccharothrix coeruleofusca TaxID=33919 RepID=A0A918AJ01_9PSEU|nr:hypothetical protein [Saccharothrix coeruleofusca]MBP2338443.1 hypothetical protein [Saccharothrix coeruleofusca]GGP48305.1 hypothetical protein GCM10010185_20400 [Saccharothrix coeruleofusca]